MCTDGKEFWDEIEIFTLEWEKMPVRKTEKSLLFHPMAW